VAQDKNFAGCWVAGSPTQDPGPPRAPNWVDFSNTAQRYQILPLLGKCRAHQVLDPRNWLEFYQNSVYYHSLLFIWAFEYSASSKNSKKSDINSYWRSSEPIILKSFRRKIQRIRLQILVTPFSYPRKIVFTLESLDRLTCENPGARVVSFRIFSNRYFQIEYFGYFQIGYFQIDFSARRS